MLRLRLPINFGYVFGSLVGRPWNRIGSEENEHPVREVGGLNVLLSLSKSHPSKGYIYLTSMLLR